jgi:hypothetical protein
VADNVTSNLGSGGPSFATDDIGGVHYPRTKMTWGADGTATDTASGSAAIPIQDGGNSITIDGTVSVSGTVDTELPAAASLADDSANPSVPGVGAFAMMYDGTTWDRARGTSADGLLVNLGANNDVTVTGTVTANAGTGTFIIGDGGGSITIDGTVDTELPAAAALGDDAANPTVPSVGAFALMYDGATWDRVRGTSVDGLLVNLGANNDVTVTGTVTVDSELPAATALADNTANPTVPAVGAFAMVFDGTTWDRLPGTTADGALVNLGANNDVTVTGTVTANAGTGTFTVDSELPAAAALADNASNPTAPAVGAFNMVFDGTTWDRLPGTSADGALVNLGANNDVTVTSLPASTKTIKRAVGTASASGNNTAIAAPGASKVIKVINYALQGQGTVNAKFTDGAGGADLTMLWNFQAREGTNLGPQVIPQFHFKCTANTALVLNLSAAVSVGYEVTYWDDDAS